MKRNFADINALESKKIKSDNLEQNYLNYVSIPSLKSTVIINVATGLCKQSDTRNAIWKYSVKFSNVESDIHDTIFNQIEIKALNQLSRLPLPHSLKAEVSNIIRPVVLQILEWMRYYHKDIECIDYIYWTTEGVINKKKTFQHLIDNDSGYRTSLIIMYKLACKHCLEDCIRNLWNKLPEEQQKYLSSQQMFETYRNHLVAFWTNTIHNEFSEFFNKIKSSDPKNIYKHNHSLYHNMFTLALSIGNTFAIKHFWYKLTDVEISTNLALWVKDAVHNKSICDKRPYQHTDKYADILFFLLSKMNGEQQKEVFQKDTHVILESLFLNWPWQRFLLPTIEVMWEFIDEKVFFKLLSRIAEEVKENKTTEKFLRELWCTSPMNLRKNVIQHMLNDNHGTDVICNLLKVDDVKTIEIMLNDANIEERKKIVFSLIENTMFRNVIYRDKMFLLDILIEKLPQGDINSVKERTALNYGSMLCHRWICDNNWKKVDAFFNWAFTSQDQICHFKKEVLHKTEITYFLLQECNYELVNKFINWCFDSEEEINNFKKYFAKSRPGIVKIGETDWSSFEKFVDWCFDSEQEINNFKSNVLQSRVLPNIMYASIGIRCNFEFFDKLLNWCCQSNEEVKRFKAEIVVSEHWMRVLKRFVSNYEADDTGSNNWELIKKLVKLFAPFEDDVIIKLKEKISEGIDFDDEFKTGYKKSSFKIKESDLFSFLDNVNLNIGDDESNINNDGDQNR